MLYYVSEQIEPMLKIDTQHCHTHMTGKCIKGHPVSFKFLGKLLSRVMLCSFIKRIIQEGHQPLAIVWVHIMFCFKIENQVNFW